MCYAYVDLPSLHLQSIYLQSLQMNNAQYFIKYYACVRAPDLLNKYITLLAVCV